MKSESIQSKGGKARAASMSPKDRRACASKAALARWGHGRQPKDRGPVIHELKTWPQYFAGVEAGTKTFELRKNDRDFQVGDTLHLREWDPATAAYTRRSVQRWVTYIVHGPVFGLNRGWVIMGIVPVPTNEG